MPIQTKQQPPYYTPGTNPKTYIGLISQSGSGIPTTINITNNLETITWVRVTDGTFTGTTTNETFFENKTLIILGNVIAGAGYTAYRTDNNTITIETFNTVTGNNTDSLLDFTPIYITIFN